MIIKVYSEWDDGTKDLAHQINMELSLWKKKLNTKIHQQDEVITLQRKRLEILEEKIYLIRTTQKLEGLK